MPKLKTHSGTKKRLQQTKTGKIMSRRAGGGHFLEKKTAARKRTYSGVREMVGKNVKSIRRNLGV